VEKKGSEWEELDENYDGVPQPPQVAEQRARFLKVVGEIEALPARQRQALVLNEFEGRCYADIAVQLGTSESGVRGLLRRARHQLREATAALLLPVPVLRELVRSDGGRAGDLLGTAGAAGGVGAAGGFAKVAAGVLAAGTIAGGGTAIQHSDDPLKVQDARSAESSTSHAKDDAETRSVLVGAPSEEAGPYAVSRIAAGGADLVAGAGLGRRHDGSGDSLDGVEQEAPTSEPPAVTEPEVPLSPLPSVPVTPGAEEEPAAEKEEPAAEEPADPEAKDEDPKNGGSKESESAESPTAEEQTGPGGGSPDAVPATPLP
jgi:hypothetical protein